MYQSTTQVSKGFIPLKFAWNFLKSLLLQLQVPLNNPQPVQQYMSFVWVQQNSYRHNVPFYLIKTFKTQSFDNSYDTKSTNARTLLIDHSITQVSKGIFSSLSFMVWYDTYPVFKLNNLKCTLSRYISKYRTPVCKCT